VSIALFFDADANGRHVYWRYQSTPGSTKVVEKRRHCTRRPVWRRFQPRTCKI